MLIMEKVFQTIQRLSLITYKKMDMDIDLWLLLNTKDLTVIMEQLFMLGICLLNIYSISQRQSIG